MVELSADLHPDDQQELDLVGEGERVLRATVAQHLDAVQDRTRQGEHALVRTAVDAFDHRRLADPIVEHVLDDGRR